MKAKLKSYPLVLFRFCEAKGLLSPCCLCHSNLNLFSVCPSLFSSVNKSMLMEGSVLYSCLKLFYFVGLHWRHYVRRNIRDKKS